MKKRRTTLVILTVGDAVDIFLQHRKGSAISPKTYAFEAWVLLQLTRAHAKTPAAALTKQDLVGLFEAEREAGFSVNTIRHILFAVRRLYKFLIAQGLVADNPADTVAAPKQEKKPIQPMDAEQVNRLLACLDVERFSGLRNKTILMLLYDTGMRIGEALGARLTDLDLDARRIHVLGKGRRPRTVYLSPTMAAALRAYLQRRGNSEGNPWLFCDEYAAGALDYVSFRHSLERARNKAAIEGVRVSAHTLRHSFAAEWVKAGGDPASLSAQLGHSSLEMTSNYVHLLSQDVARIQERVSPLERMGQAPARKKRL
jgi:integrase/recombinase XerD